VASWRLRASPAPSRLATPPSSLGPVPLYARDADSAAAEFRPRQVSSERLGPRRPFSGLPRPRRQLRER
jgi:hypothetical protein